MKIRIKENDAPSVVQVKEVEVSEVKGVGLVEMLIDGTEAKRVYESGED